MKIIIASKLVPSGSELSALLAVKTCLSGTVSEGRRGSGFGQIKFLLRLPPFPQRNTQRKGAFAEGRQDNAG